MSAVVSQMLNRLSRRRSEKASKLRVTGLCAGNSPVTGEFPAQRASNAENVSIWWRHHVCVTLMRYISRRPTFIMHISDVTWVLRRLNSQATRPFGQHVVKANNKERWKFCIIAPLWGEPPVTGDSPHKGSVMRKALPSPDDFTMMAFFITKWHIVHLGYVTVIRMQKILQNIQQ